VLEKEVDNCRANGNNSQSDHPMVWMVQLLDDLLLCTVSNVLSGGEVGAKYCQGCYGVVGIEDDEAVV
jgi:hypothetical protein